MTICADLKFIYGQKSTGFFEKQLMLLLCQYIYLLCRSSSKQNWSALSMQIVKLIPWCFQVNILTKERKNLKIKKLISFGIPRGLVDFLRVFQSLYYPPFQPKASISRSIVTVRTRIRVFEYLSKGVIDDSLNISMWRYDVEDFFIKNKLTGTGR